MYVTLSPHFGHLSFVEKNNHVKITSVCFCMPEQNKVLIFFQIFISLKNCYYQAVLENLDIRDFLAFHQMFLSLVGFSSFFGGGCWFWFLFLIQTLSENPGTSLQIRFIKLTKYHLLSCLKNTEKWLWRLTRGIVLWKLGV